MKKYIILFLMGQILISCQKEIKEKTILVRSKQPHFILNQNNTSSNYNIAYLPTSTTKQIVKHDYYTLSYNEKFEQAEWVAYELKKEYLNITQKATFQS